MAEAAVCSNHPEVSALARCHRCNDGLCNDCFRLLLDRSPICDRCAAELERGPPSRWPFGIAFASIGATLSLAAARWQGADPSWEIWGFAVVLSVVIGVIIGFTGPKRASAVAPNLHEREVELEPDPDLLARAAHPYRTRVARVVRRIVPLSGRSTAALLTAAFVVSAIAVPSTLRWPHWVEAELVLAVWWTAIFGLLTTLLFKGLRLTHDHRFELGTPSLGKGSSSVDLSGCSVGDGCGEALLIVLVLAVAAVLAWALVEIVLPLLFFGIYYFVVKAIGRVARDTHGCAGNLGRSALWGALWSTLYLVPIAGLVWGAHALMSAH